MKQYFSKEEGLMYTDYYRYDDTSGIDCVYRGQIGGNGQNKKFHGYGMVYSKNDYYIGWWKDGIRNGQGVSVY